MTLRGSRVTGLTYKAESMFGIMKYFSRIPKILRKKRKNGVGDRLHVLKLF